ncbi:MAG: CaiB/BaiF CoA-transferase family protein [Burkholderiaceae bacterium]
MSEVTPPAHTGDDAPLTGYVVVDFTRVMSGPYCTRLLADLGATVIKIERPGEGDEVRYILPQLNPERTDQSAYFARLNAGKQSVAINFSHPAARQVIHDLVRKADVVIENFSPGVMGKYGFDEPGLRAVKPDLVYCSISGFGQTGPLRSLQAYAHLINAFSGMMELETGGVSAPRASNLQAADVLAGAHAFGSICASLLRRARSGQGAYLDVSMLECLVAADDINFSALLNGATVTRQPRPGMVVHPIGEASLAMQIGGAPTMWPRLTELMGKPELLNDERFANPGARRKNWSALSALIGDWLAGFDSVDQAVELLAQARMPSVPMLKAEDVVAHPHMAARGAFPKVNHPVSGTARVTATPFQLDGQAVVPSGPVPYAIGEHTDAVLGNWLGYSAAQLDELRTQAVIAG